MRKKNFLVLQFTLAALLLILGILVEVKGNNARKGAAALMMAIPGLLMLIACPLEKCQQRWYWYLIAYLVILLACDGVTILVMQIKFDSWLLYLFVFIVDLLADGICFLFHMIYYNIKNFKLREK